MDWGEALNRPSFYGREQELATLWHWVLEERCRLVSVLGMGGMGKSALVVRAMQGLAEHFEVVIFRSLRDAPECSTLLESCLQVLSSKALTQLPPGLEPRLSRLLEEMRNRRVLLVLDNLESLLQAGDLNGWLRSGFEDYDHLLRRLSEAGHQSCLLLTSRERPTVLRTLEGSRLPVRSLRLDGLDIAAGQQLLAEHGVKGTSEEHARLLQVYSGNPLALQIVTETISDLFGGEIRPFLSVGTAIFGSICELLEEQWVRLSPLEQTLLYWLAILREPATLEELLSVLVTPLARVQLLEAVEGLRRRSLIERGQLAGSFTLQSVVLEFVTDRLVSTACLEIQHGQLRLLREHGLSQALAKEFVRQTQHRLLLSPLLERLQRVYQGRAQLEERLCELLHAGRGLSPLAQGYAPANLLTLLRLLHGHLRGLDLSRLLLRGVHLQAVAMQDTTLSGALLQECVFTESFDAITAVAISPDGRYWAASGRRGEVQVWEWEQATGPILHRVWQAHTDRTDALAFSPDGRLLATGSWDNTLKLWDIESSALRWSSWHPRAIHSLAFAPDGPSSASGSGRLLATGGSDATVRLWDLQTGTQVQTLPHPSRILSVAWSPHGHLLASGDFEGQIRLWEIGQNRSAACVQSLSGQSNRVLRLAFAPDGRTLASAGGDCTVKLWDVGQESSLSLRQTLSEQSDLVFALAWSPDGRMLASGGHDHTIWLWDVESSRSRTTLPGHTAIVHGLAFMPDSRRLLSGSEDGTLRLWDAQRGEALRVLQGYAASLFDVDWSPDGARLASAGSDGVVSIWELERETPPEGLHGHGRVVYGVAFSPDGRLLASSGWDDAVRLWDASTGERRQTLRDPDHVGTFFFGVAFSPDGRLLASATSPRGVYVWETTTGNRWWAEQQLSSWVHRLAWSPDGAWLVGGGDDGQVYVWDGSDGTLLQSLAGHHGVVMDVAWSPDGKRLVSAGRSGELVVWDVQNWQPVRSLAQQAGIISAVAWSPDGSRLISGSSDGRLCWWQVHGGECIWVREAHQGMVYALKVSPDGSTLASCGDDGAITLWDLELGEHLRTLRRDRPYERLNITRIRGLTEAELATLRALGAIEDTGVNWEVMGSEMPSAEG